MVEQLATLERTFEEKIRRKRRGMSEQELQALFDEYRRNQLSIIKQTNSQKMRLDDKLKQKMAQRRRKGRVSFNYSSLLGQKRPDFCIDQFLTKAFSEHMYKGNNNQNSINNHFKISYTSLYMRYSKVLM